MSNFQPLEPSDGLNPVQEFLANLGGAILALVVAGGTLAMLECSTCSDRSCATGCRIPRSRESALPADGAMGHPLWVQYATGIHAAELGGQLAAELFPVTSTAVPTYLPTPPEVVVATYVRATYGRRQISRSERRMVDKAWRRVRMRNRHPHDRSALASADAVSRLINGPGRCSRHCGGRTGRGRARHHAGSTHYRHAGLASAGRDSGRRHTDHPVSPGRPWTPCVRPRIS